MAALQTCLVVIARDEAPRIRRLLDSVAPWVDCMLVLDTGSTDDTVALARAAGAQVAHFSWCDDFAAARNAALALAAADWHLVLDADEWLIAGGESLHALRQLPTDFVGAVQLIDQDTAGAGTVSDWLSRVLPGALRYAGRVHEQPQHALAVRRLPVQIGHDGYAPQRLAAKRGRNRPLLLADIAAAPRDAYLWYQLGKDHATYDEHESAAQAFAQAEAMGPGAAAWRHDLATRRLFALKKTGQHAQALACAQTRLADCAGSPDFFFALGDLLLDWAADAPSRADELLPMAEAAWTRCLEIGERPDLPGAVQGRGSHLAAHNLAVIHEALGWPARALALRRRHPVPFG
jgi:tetratricopeptide (TPR) repeat protein